MPIQLHRPKCKSTAALRKRNCKKCGHPFAQGKMYRVVVKAHDGRRVTKMLSDLGPAKQCEGKMEAQSTRRQLFGVTTVPLEVTAESRKCLRTFGVLP
jgi:hypothetical protein